MNHMRRRAEETFLAEFALDVAGRQIGMRLPRRIAFHDGAVEPFGHARFLMRPARRGGSGLLRCSRTAPWNGLGRNLRCPCGGWSRIDRKSVGKGKGVSVRVVLGGRRQIIQNKSTNNKR